MSNLQLVGKNQVRYKKYAWGDSDHRYSKYWNDSRDIAYGGGDIRSIQLKEFLKELSNK